MLSSTWYISHPGSPTSRISFAHVQSPNAIFIHIQSIIFATNSHSDKTTQTPCKFQHNIPSFKLNFAAGLFEGVIPGTASGGRQHKKFGWNETFDVEDRLLVLLRCMHRIGFGTISDLLAALFATEVCSSWKGWIAERLHFSSNRSPSMVENSLQLPSEVPLSLDPPSQQISSQNYMIKT